MKTLKFVIAKVCVLVLFLSNTAVATSVSSFEILTTPDEKAFMLSAETSGEGKLGIQIQNNEGEIVFSRSMKALASFQQKYSLKDFEKGNYSLVITDVSKIITQPFEVTETAVEVNSNLQKTAFKPYFKFNEEVESLAVNWMKSDNSNCKFTIEDEKFNILFDESVENNGMIHRSYDFSQLPKGTYYIIIKDGNHAYNETIDIN
ncbi:MAG: hypothetical protein AB8G11_21615 [Saprospiraceae bacterium]